MSKQKIDQPRFGKKAGRSLLNFLYSIVLAANLFLATWSDPTDMNLAILLTASVILGAIVYFVIWPYFWGGATIKKRWRKKSAVVTRKKTRHSKLTAKALWFKIDDKVGGLFFIALFSFFSLCLLVNLNNYLFIAPATLHEAEVLNKYISTTYGRTSNTRHNITFLIDGKTVVTGDSWKTYDHVEPGDRGVIEIRKGLLGANVYIMSSFKNY